MARTLDEGFQILLDGLTPDDNRPDIPEDLLDHIRDCLSNHFGLYAFFLGGSLLRNTHLRGHGGVDYFASLDDARLSGDSDSFLDEVRRVIGECFSDKDVAARAPAIIVPVGPDDSRVIRVVPAKLDGQTKDSHQVYAVADGMGKWMKSSPDAHRAYVDTLDHDLDGKLRPLIRLLKAWKHWREVPISSFYLEMRCVEYAAGEKMIVYTVDLRNVMELLWDDQFADVQDPQGISGHVPARLTYAGKKIAISRLRTALYHTSRAQEAMEGGKVEEAFQYWNRVFNGHFATYG
jgi:hypothetical protein